MIFRTGSMDAAHRGCPTRATAKDENSTDRGGARRGTDAAPPLSLRPRLGPGSGRTKQTKAPDQCNPASEHQAGIDGVHKDKGVARAARTQERVEDCSGESNAQCHADIASQGEDARRNALLDRGAEPIKALLFGETKSPVPRPQSARPAVA